MADPNPTNIETKLIRTMASKNGEPIFPSCVNRTPPTAVTAYPVKAVRLDEAPVNMREIVRYLDVERCEDGSRID